MPPRAWRTPPWPSPSWIAGTTICSSRCSTRWPRPRSIRATSPRPSARSSGNRRTPRCCSPRCPRWTWPPARCGSPTGSSWSYDYLIVGTGAHHSYFGRDEWESLAPGLKSLEDALEIRRRVLVAFELAEREPDIVRRHAYLTFVVVGGGPTGVETAGAVAEIRRYALRRDFRHIDPGEATVLLLEGGPRLLPPIRRSWETRPSSTCGASAWRFAPRRW